MPLGRIAGPPVTPLSLTIPARKSATTCFSAAFSASRRSVRASRSPRDSSERGIFSGTNMLGTNRVRYEQGQPRSSSYLPGFLPQVLFARLRDCAERIFEVSRSVMEAMMLDRIVEVFCEVDDFCQAFLPQWEASLLGPGGTAPRGPEPGLSPSEIIMLLLTVQASNISRASITASPSRWLLSRPAVLRALRQPAEKRLRAAGGLPPQPPGDQDRALLHRLHRPCDNHRLSRHKVFAGLPQRGKMGWFFGFKLHLVFNNDNEIIALKLTPGNVHDTKPVPALT